jgi:tetratricopeptide (TPR) repeat protein
MLLDQKRTKRLVKIAAVLTSVAFAGVAVVIIAVIIFGGTPSATGQQVSDARERVRTEPENAIAWDRLASALDADGKPDEAIDAARRAVALAPRQFSRTLTLTRLYEKYGRINEALRVVQAYTRRNPTDADAFVKQGQLAQELGLVPLARLSYQRYLQLDPEGPTADAVRQQLQSLSGAPAAVPTAP